MNPTNLREEIAVELEAMEIMVNELLALQQDLAEREPTIRESTAAAAFLAQFYSGLENILKRISHFHSVPVPKVKPGTWSYFNASLIRLILICHNCSTLS